MGKILLVWDRVGDYHAARFFELEKVYGAGMVFISDFGSADEIYKWKNPVAHQDTYKSLSACPVEKSDFWNRISNFISLVRKEKITILGLAGYGRIEYIFFLFLCKIMGVEVVLFAESWYGDNKIFNALKGFFLKIFCKGFLVSGIRAKNHFSHKLSIPLHKIETVYSVVDNHHFDAATNVEKENIMLCVARFSPEKNLVRLISAFKKSRISNAWKLKIVGGGPMKTELLRLAGDDKNLQLSDWLSYAALPILYAHARFFILPSTFEPWGLVVNEAMAAGLPIALSDQCGCTPDFMQGPINFTFDAHDEDALISILDKISKLKPIELNSLGANNRQKIRNFSTQIWTKNFLNLAFG